MGLKEHDSNPDSVRLGTTARSMTLKGLEDLGSLERGTSLPPCLMTIFYDDESKFWISAFVGINKDPGTLTMSKVDIDKWSESEIVDVYTSALSANPGIPIVIDRKLADKFKFKRKEGDMIISVYDDPSTERGIVAYSGATFLK